MRLLIIIVGTMTLLLLPQPAAQRVTVKGVHLCCGSCLSTANDALSDIDGVTDASSDLNSKVVSFSVASPDAAEAGIAALAKAGFFGTAFLDGKGIPYPKSGVKKGAKSNVFTLTGVHLCCTSCVSASQKALQEVKGVTLIDIDRNERTIKLTGDSIDITAAVAALNKAGFFGKLQESKK